MSSAVRAVTTGSIFGCVPSPSETAVLDGLADHTLTRIPNPELFASMLENTILGLSLRFFPREAHYLEESHQSARANIEEAIRVILAAVRA